MRRAAYPADRLLKEPERHLMMKGMSTRLLGIVGLLLFCTSRLALGGESPAVVSQLTCTDTYSCCLQRNAGRPENCGDVLDSAAASAAAAAAIAELAVAKEP
jgi:hypothetical protein